MLNTSNELILRNVNKEIRKAREKSLISLFLIAVALIAFGTITEFSYSKAIEGAPKSVIWMFKNLMPTADSFTYIGDILYQLSLTILSAIAAATCAALIAYILALFASDTMAYNGIVVNAIRIVASFFRNIPDVVWSMIFLFSFGQNIFTGFLAMFLATLGTLIRSFINVIDQSSGSSVEALVAAGGNRVQIVGQAIFPDSIAGTISWILYAIENNIRTATLIGILTGSGIGYLFNVFYTGFRYDVCGLVVLVITAVILFIQWVSNVVRKSVL